jgi:hypothetical protein
VGPIPTLDPRLVDQPEVGLVDQARRAEGVIGTFELKPVVGDAVQLVVHQREEPVHARRPVLAQLQQQVGDWLVLAGHCRLGSPHDRVSQRLNAGRRVVWGARAQDGIGYQVPQSPWG